MSGSTSGRTRHRSSHLSPPGFHRAEVLRWSFGRAPVGRRIVVGGAVDAAVVRRVLRLNLACAGGRRYIPALPRRELFRHAPFAHEVGLPALNRATRGAARWL